MMMSPGGEVRSMAAAGKVTPRTPEVLSLRYRGESPTPGLHLTPGETTPLSQYHDNERGRGGIFSTQVKSFFG